jgi:glycosyltransferase involved in cell wall biosynthesis
LTSLELTIVTVTYNSAEQLKKFWALAPTSFLNWVVIDNNSQDDSAEVAEYLGATKVIDSIRISAFQKHATSDSNKRRQRLWVS